MLLFTVQNHLVRIKRGLEGEAAITEECITNYEGQLDAIKREICAPLKIVNQWLQRAACNTFDIRSIENTVVELEMKLNVWRTHLEQLKMANKIEEADRVFQSLKEVSSLRTLTTHERCLLHIFGYSPLFDNPIVSENVQPSAPFSDVNVTSDVATIQTENMKIESLQTNQYPVFNSVSAEFRKELEGHLERRFSRPQFTPTFDFQKHPTSVFVDAESYKPAFDFQVNPGPISDVCIDIVDDSSNLKVPVITISAPVESLKESDSFKELEPLKESDSFKELEPLKAGEPLKESAESEGGDGNWETISMENEVSS